MKKNWKPQKPEIFTDYENRPLNRSLELSKASWASEDSVCVALQKSRLNGPSSLSHTTAKEWHGFRQHKPGQPRRYQPQNAQPDRLLGLICSEICRLRRKDFIQNLLFFSTEAQMIQGIQCIIKLLYVASTDDGGRDALIP